METIPGSWRGNPYFDKAGFKEMGNIFLDIVTLQDFHSQFPGKSLCIVDSICVLMATDYESVHDPVVVDCEGSVLVTT